MGSGIDHRGFDRAERRKQLKTVAVALRAGNNIVLPPVPHHHVKGSSIYIGGDEGVDQRALADRTKAKMQALLNLVGADSGSSGSNNNDAQGDFDDDGVRSASCTPSRPLRTRAPARQPQQPARGKALATTPTPLPPPPPVPRTISRCWVQSWWTVTASTGA